MLCNKASITLPILTLDYQTILPQPFVSPCSVFMTDIVAYNICSLRGIPLPLQQQCVSTAEL